MIGAFGQDQKGLNNYPKVLIKQIGSTWLV
jgi:hypothetical protein